MSPHLFVGNYTIALEATAAERGTIRHLERVDWSPYPFSPPDLDQWPFTIPAVAELIRNEGLESRRA